MIIGRLSWACTIPGGVMNVDCLERKSIVLSLRINLAPIPRNYSLTL